MPSPSFTLDAQLRFHDKWLKIDLQRAFSPEGLSEMWNEMVKDEEITFSGEESAHTEDCTDCFGTQKKDEPTTKRRKRRRRRPPPCITPSSRPGTGAGSQMRRS
ncbi:E3 ubiquitin-protein ligase HERC2 [Dissostichus eleginoides]|uniref:E3 ubiquitin-protein ligase HERC2 n=1 Tax=Dissostichus eleginoides TaxID=100907 RepID=A0AAD9FCH7_DISEL|nr:E3 ubiquitin-protein ligase HERC2 [Dissostichus eleginoides]